MRRRFCWSCFVKHSGLIRNSFNVCSHGILDLFLHMDGMSGRSATHCQMANGTIIRIDRHIP